MGTPTRSHNTIADTTGNGVVVRAPENETGEGVNISGRTYQVWEVNASAGKLYPAGAPTASAVTDTTLTLTWDAPAGRPASGGTPSYQPEVAETPFEEADFAAAGDPVTALTADITGLTAETVYQFRIVTTAGGVESTGSATSVTTDAAA